MINLILAANLVYAITFSLYRFKSQYLAASLAFVWTCINVAIVYYLVNVFGGSEPYLGLFGVELPLYSAVPCSLAILLLTLKEVKGGQYKLFLLFVIVAGCTLFRYFQGMSSLVTSKDSELALVTYMFVLVIPFQLSFICPSVIFMGEGISLAKRIFGFSAWKTEDGPGHILIGSMAFVATYFMGQFITKGALPRPLIYSSLDHFLIYAILVITYLVLVDHFVFFVLANRALGQFWSAIPAKLLKPITYASVYSLFHWNHFQVSAVVMYFFYGIVFWYLFERTKSITYGILLLSLSYLMFG